MSVAEEERERKKSLKQREEEALGGGKKRDRRGEIRDEKKTNMKAREINRKNGKMWKKNYGRGCGQRRTTE